MIAIPTAPPKDQYPKFNKEWITETLVSKGAMFVIFSIIYEIKKRRYLRFTVQNEKRNNFKTRILPNFLSRCNP